MTIERSSEPLLIEMVTNETNATAKNEETVERANLNVFVGFFTGEGTTIAQKINEADSNATIDVEDKLELNDESR